MKVYHCYFACQRKKKETKREIDMLCSDSHLWGLKKLNHSGAPDNKGDCAILFTRQHRKTKQHTHTKQLYPSIKTKK